MGPEANCRMTKVPSGLYVFSCIIVSAATVVCKAHVPKTADPGCRLAVAAGLRSSGAGCPPKTGVMRPASISSALKLPKAGLRAVEERKDAQHGALTFQKGAPTLAQNRVPRNPGLSSDT